SESLVRQPDSSPINRQHGGNRHNSDIMKGGSVSPGTHYRVERCVRGSVPPLQSQRRLVTCSDARWPKAKEDYHEKAQSNCRSRGGVRCSPDGRVGSSEVRKRRQRQLVASS